MIFNLDDPGQHSAFHAAVETHMFLYGNAYAKPVGKSLVLLIEPWVNPAAVR